MRFFLTHTLILSCAMLATACGDTGVECASGVLMDGRCVLPPDAAASGDSGTAPDASAAPDAGIAADAGTDACAPDEFVCNGLDDDCDGIVDEGVQTIFYADMDMDGFGDPDTSCAACDVSECPEGVWLDNDGDCDDSDAAVLPASDPSAPETLCNEIDDDCDGTVDEGAQRTFYRDADADGFGDPAEAIEACTAPGGYVDNDDDCADSDDRAFPGQTEYFSTSIVGHPGVYDFDCSGRVEYVRDSEGSGVGPVRSARPVPPGRCTDRCDGQDHWVNSFPPCGSTASYWYCGVTLPSGVKWCFPRRNALVVTARALCH